MERERRAPCALPGGTGRTGGHHPCPKASASAAMRPSPAALLAFTALALAPVEAVAQRGLDPSKAVTQYAADAWGIEDGLPMSVVEAAAQTTDGHLWLGTQEGLARFDGARFEVVDAHRADGLPDNTVMALAADRSGGLWVGMRDGGLARLDRNLRVTLFGEAQGLPSKTVAALAVDRAGRVWAGTRAGLCALDPRADRPRFRCWGEAAGLADPYVRELHLGRDGALWLGTRAGLFRFANGRIASLAHLGGAAAEPITALRADASGGLWVGSLAGLGYLTRGALTRPPEAERFDGVEISALFVDGVGSLWVGTYGEGLFRLRNGRAEGLSATGRADLRSVRALHLDREGSLWVGTAGGGLARLRDAKFTPFGAPEGLGADRTYATAADPRGGVWVGTSGGGVARIEGGRVMRRLTTADGLASDDVATVLATRDGALWVGLSGAGLCRWDGRRTTCFDEADGLPDPFVLALYEDRRGQLWIGSDAGLSRWTGRGLAPASAEGAPAAPVVSFAETADGALWVGTFGDGLYRLAGGRFTHHPDLAGAVILTLHARPDGALWAGTDGDGLARIRPDGRGGFTSDRFTTREGLLSDAVLQILEDRQGRLWLTSNRGIARIALVDLDRVARGAAERVVPVVYDQRDGLRSAECNGGTQPAGAVAADGSLWFPTTAGVATLDPAAIRTNPTAPPVVVQHVLVNERAVALGRGPLTLAAGSREFRFEYAGLSFAAPGRVRHRYRLEGRDDGWTEAADRRAAFYTDLAPGAYTFRVQASNDDGVWNRSGAAVAFTIQPYFWQTTWFAALCVLGVAAGGWGTYRVRTAQLKARAAHLETVVDQRTHELRDALDEVQTQKTTIEAQADELAGLNADLEAKVREQLAELVRKSRLQKFFPQKVVRQILEGDAEVTVGAERKRVTVFFSDLTGFTRMSDTTPPEVVTRLLNEYLNQMVALIDEHGGTLDKFMGDGIMVLFGAADDMPPETQARQAVRMAAAMQRALADLRTQWEADGLAHRVDMRIGINQDDVTVGNFGSDALVEYTAIGGGVNLASRLEGACAPGQALVSLPVFALTKEEFAYDGGRAYTLKGLAEPVPAYLLDVAAVPEEAEAAAG